MITVVRLVNISISPYSYHSCVCVCMCKMRAPEIYSFSKFPVYNTVLLTIVIMLYIRFVEHIHYI